MLKVDLKDVVGTKNTKYNKCSTCDHKKVKKSDVQTINEIGGTSVHQNVLLKDNVNLLDRQGSPQDKTETYPPASRKKIKTGYLGQERTEKLRDLKICEEPPNKVKIEDDTFIHSFPSVHSNYWHKKSMYKFLESTLNIIIMYSLYKEKCLEAQRIAISIEKYRKIFREYKLKFHKPKKDRCQVYVATKERAEYGDNDEESYKEHCNRREAARKLSDSVYTTEVGTARNKPEPFEVEQKFADFVQINAIFVVKVIVIQVYHLEK
ncbi:unnamed protein product [Diabrotica balteata]|uniref:Uncharacterized protein n=1 Tax=Diabrotica balteata TaxID=107213 RepID=A0A9N9XFN1_DIABA|nr:unnamed protein product [Diabrotica balteata]